MIEAAWFCAAFSRQKKLPKLSKLFKKKGQRKQQQTDEQMLEIVKALNTAYGGEVIE